MAPNGMSITAGSLLALTVVLFGVGQFVPWAEVSGSGGAMGFSFSFESTASMWEFEAGGQSNGFGGSDSVGWYNDDVDDMDGVGMIRAAIPLVLAGTAAALVGAVLAFTGVRLPGGIVAAAGALLLVLGFIFFTVGIGDVYDGEQDWHAGFYVGLVGLLTAVAGAVFAFLHAPMASGAGDRGAAY